MGTILGIGVAPGIAFGHAMIVTNRERDVPRYRIPREAVSREVRRFLRARRRARVEITELRERAAATVGEKYAAIFDAHVMILEDRKLGRDTFDLICHRRMNAEWALAATIGRVLRTLGAVEDPYLRERTSDIEDVHQRLQRVLAGHANQHVSSLDLAEDTIVVAPTLSPSDALWLHQPGIVGLITEDGGRTSHTAILANALEIPAVLGAKDAVTSIDDGQFVIVDGARGHVVLNPTDSEREAYASARADRQRREARFEAERGTVRTRDGVEVVVAANIEFPEEMETCRRLGAQGVGLYRSEFLFLSTSPKLPTEADHEQAYEWIARAALPDPVVVRTLDLGGEKYFHDVLDGGESNPVMGLRAVRFCLQRPDIFRTQLRGLLRVAARSGNVRILVPMISSVSEWREVKAFVLGVREEIERVEGALPAVPLGCMIEIPGAALQADALAAESDFLAIGTNDLIQYTLAVDRSNASVSSLYDPFHPAVLELIERSIDAGKARGIPVSLCGEMASDALGALVLLGLGLERFSCNAVLVPEIRRLLRGVERSVAARVVDEARSASGGASLRPFVEHAFREVIAAALGS